MSSADVRAAITNAVKVAADPYPVYDLSDYLSTDEILDAAGDSERVIIVQYVTADNEMQNIAGEGNQGWREDGSVTVHILTASGFASTPIVSFGDSLVQAINGQRLTADITVENMTPFSDFANAATGIRGGTVKGWASNLFYVKRDCY